jgi:acetolactate synthase-1/2/3 large subunit
MAAGCEPPGDKPMTRSAAALLVESLAAHVVDRIFCVPGESYLSVLDALLDRPEIEVVTCRHESGAGFMAVADAKITRRPGVAFVSRGPGATNAAIAVHTAEQDAVPMVLFVGQIATTDRGRRAFQEVSYEKTFADMAKWVAEVGRADMIPETVARAFHVAQSGTPGPVVVSLPEDMLSAETAAAVTPPQPVALARPAEPDVAAAAARLAQAERPLLIVGGGIDSPRGRAALARFSEAWRLPVATSFKRQDLFDNTHPNFAANLGFNIPREQVALLTRADLVLAVGTRLGDITTQGYTLPRAPKPAEPLIHVHADPGQLGRVYATDLGIVADPVAFLEALAERAPATAPAGRDAWIDTLHGYHRNLAAWQPLEPGDGVDFGHVVQRLIGALPDDAVLVTDAGNFSSWVHRHFPFTPKNLLLGAVSGAMGFGMPAAVAAALRLRGREVVSFIGDGGFLMTGNELATAVAHDLPIRVFVANNRSYGTIRLHQEKNYPGRTIATDLRNPDFAVLAEAFGARGLRLDRAVDAGDVVRDALATPGPVIVDVRSSLSHISAYTTIAQLRARTGTTTREGSSA